MWKSVWDALMDQSQEIDEDTPLVMDLQSGERYHRPAANIGRISRTLKEIRSLCTEKSNDRHPERDEMITVNNVLFIEGLVIDDEEDQKKGDAPTE
ncbi:unnamed protein product [Nippostrongylus brasiliensis]|uniref:Polyprotein n=1 Tax=Nippostrongylus brasiliensis TaxID=27835 RepID=A0A0N4YYH5_NIPBR|nr:unnamed protein product [Nippostrongylus brasiliensis]